MSVTPSPPTSRAGSCAFCQSGRTHLCGKGGPGIGLGRHGGLAELVDAPLINLAPIPDGVDAVTASLTEPLAVTVHGVGLADVRPDDRVLVLGAGTIGLCAALVARDRAAEVAITARHPHQRAAAERLGVTVLDEADAVTWGKEHRPEVVIESVGGVADTLTDAIRVVGRGGRIVLLGSFSEPKALELQRLMMKEVAFARIVLLRRWRPRAGVRHRGAATGRWSSELAALTTHQYDLDDVTPAFTTAADKSTGAIKVTLTV